MHGLADSFGDLLIKLERYFEGEGLECRLQLESLLTMELFNYYYYVYFLFICRRVVSPPTLPVDDRQDSAKLLTCSRPLLPVSSPEAQ